MAFFPKEIGGYTGKEIELWVKPATDEDTATSITAAPSSLVQIRGAQNFSPNQEKSETKVNEMGYTAQKTIYGTVSYTVSTTLMFRDLLQIARMGGIPTASKTLNVDRFGKVNAVNYIKDPDTKAILSTIFSLGYKARTSNKSQAVEANSQVTLDGSADLVVEVEGQGYVRQYSSSTATTCPIDGVNKCFIIDGSLGATITAARVKAVENPEGNLLEEDGVGWDGATFSTCFATGTDGISCILFTTAPEKGTTVRIVYTLADLS